MATTAREVYDSFESSFQDKCIIPEALELIWLKKAIGRYSVELDELTYEIITPEIDSESEEETEIIETIIFDSDLDQYVIDTLAHFMKQSYQEREVSKVNKRINITGHDISIGAGGYDKTAAKNELLYDEEKSSYMVNNQKPTAYV